MNPFALESYIPTHEKKWEAGEDGSFTAQLYTAHGIVEFFTYPGGQHGEPFTTLEIYIGFGVQQNGIVYHARLPRSYHKKWIARLCFAFAEQAHQAHEGRRQ